MHSEEFIKPQTYRENFLVEDIATFPVSCCASDELIREVYKQYPDYDFIPVKKEGKIIGVLERNLLSENEITDHVEDHLRHLDDGIMIESNAYLYELIDRFRSTSYYKLVVRGSKIDGIITKSDFLKLPVRVYAFSLISELELLMKRIIQIKWKKDTNGWLDLLSLKRKENINKIYENFKKERMEPDLLEFTYFEDKGTILKKSFSILTDKFCNDIGSIVQLRDALVHARNYLQNDRSLQNFLIRLDKTNEWISFLLNELLNDSNSKH